MKKLVFSCAAVIACIALVRTASSGPPHPGGGPAPQGLEIQYPTLHQACAGAGVPGPRIVGYDGWPHPPIATSTICVAAGKCMTQNVPCWPYSCDTATKACRTSCAKNSDCGTLGRCLNAQCVPNQRSYCAGVYVATLDGTSSFSTPYACDENTGEPLRACRHQGECAAHYQCNSSSQCEPSGR